MIRKLDNINYVATAIKEKEKIHLSGIYKIPIVTNINNRLNVEQLI